MFMSDQNRVVVVSGGAERFGFKLGVQESKANKRTRCHIVLDFSGSAEQFLDVIGMTRVHGQNPPPEYHFLATPFQGDQCRMFLRAKSLTALGATYEVLEDILERGSDGFIGNQEMQDWAPFKDHLFTEAGHHVFEDAIRTVFLSAEGNAIRLWQQTFGNFKWTSVSPLETVVSCLSEVRAMDVLARIHRLPLGAQELIFKEVYRQLMTNIREIIDTSGHVYGKNLFHIYMDIDTRFKNNNSNNNICCAIFSEFPAGIKIVKDDDIEKCALLALGADKTCEMELVSISRCISFAEVMATYDGGNFLKETDGNSVLFRLKNSDLVVFPYCCILVSTNCYYYFLQFHANDCTKM